MAYDGHNNNGYFYEIGNKNDKNYNYEGKKECMSQQETNKEDIKNDKEAKWIFVQNPQQDANKSFRMQLSNINEPTESAVLTYHSKNKRYYNNNNYDGHKRNNMRSNNENSAQKSTTSYAGRVDNYNYNNDNNNNNHDNDNNNNNEKRYAVYYDDDNNNNNNKKYNELNNIYNNNSGQLNNSQLLSMSLLNGDNVDDDVTLPQKHRHLKSSDDVLIRVDNKAAAVLPTKADNCVVDVENTVDDNDVLVPYDVVQIAETTNDDNYSDELNMNLLYGIQNAAPRKKRSSSLTTTSYQSLCPTTRSVIPLETEMYEYRPQTYVEVKCAHNYMPHLEYDPNKNKICSEAGFYCIQLNRTIQLIRRRKHINAECWESEMRIVPSGCECMWPKHNYGDIITYHIQPQKRIRKPLQLLKMQKEPQESQATKQTLETSDFDWQMSPSKRQLTLNDVHQRQARTPTSRMALSNAITDREFY